MPIPVELLLNLARHPRPDQMATGLQAVEKVHRQVLSGRTGAVHPVLELWKLDSEPIDFKRVIFLPSDRCLSDAGFRYTET